VIAERLAGLALLAAVAACAAVPPPNPPSPCGADKAAAFVGRQATSAVRAEVAASVGERTIRWIRPGDVVTQDFIETRLNVMLDGKDVITGARCG